MIRKTMYIDGEWRSARSGRQRDIINPYDGLTIAQVAEGGREDAVDAIAAARKAFDTGPWPHTPAVERARLLFRLADMVEAENDDLARLESLDQRLQRLLCPGALGRVPSVRPGPGTRAHGIGRVHRGEAHLSKPCHATARLVRCMIASAKGRDQKPGHPDSKFYQL